MHLSSIEQLHTTVSDHVRASDAQQQQRTGLNSGEEVGATDLARHSILSPERANLLSR
ncbi:hypothetical protein XPA_010087 [Xanthoria parietina]